MAAAGPPRGALAQWFAKVPAALPARRFEQLRALLFALALLPLARLVYLGFAGGLGANPVEFVTRSLGTWALVMLCVTLSITPLRQLTGWAWLLRLRRMAGLFCFAYALLHVSTYAVLDHWLDLPAIFADIVKRPYITAGFAAFAMLVPLAVTSTNAMVRRLGARNWQRLHRLVYVIALAAILHFWWHKAGKNDFGEPTIYAIVIGGLLGVRLARWFNAR
jgi:methionine sulfoxide reductase heme-binding subunit